MFLVVVLLLQSFIVNADANQKFCWRPHVCRTKSEHSKLPALEDDCTSVSQTFEIAPAVEDDCTSVSRRKEEQTILKLLETM